MIEQLLADPRRIVQARTDLHLSQQVQYFSWSDGKLNAARVASDEGQPRVTLIDARAEETPDQRALRRHHNAGSARRERR